MKDYINLSTVSKMAEKFAAKLQEEALKVRKELFYDSVSGYDHYVGGVRTMASIKQAEAHVDNLTGGLIRFKFRSHRLLWFTFRGVDKRYILHCANQYDFRVTDSDKTNPYLQIESELLKAASELMLMKQTCSQIYKEVA